MKKCYCVNIKKLPTAQADVVDHNEKELHLEYVYSLEEFEAEFGLALPDDILSISYEPYKELYIIRYFPEDSDPVVLKKPQDHPFMLEVHKACKHIHNKTKQKMKDEHVDMKMEDWGNMLEGYESIEAEE